MKLFIESIIKIEPPYPLLIHLAKSENILWLKELMTKGKQKLFIDIIPAFQISVRVAQLVRALVS